MGEGYGFGGVDVTGRTGARELWPTARVPVECSTYVPPPGVVFTVSGR
ncbi:hypothetical protein SMD11_6739 [Streptomyces albireticuli]|uniref:Uncharacterized protein n=1 Tax=Streptomyces albireticuli TaxID=1940 RepID=A0A1Z2LDH2_9ACTN|nr:hypothetical protein SMD11_6739 [Streptomyces albireticuli]